MRMRLARWGLIILCLNCPHARAGIATHLGNDQGALLLGELHCTNCHLPKAEATPRIQPRQAPVLADAASRVTASYMAAFLADPQKTKPGTAMPDMLHDLEPTARNDAAAALAAYLRTLGRPLDTSTATASDALIAQGQRLYHTVGCVACHQPLVPPPAGPEDDEAPTEIPPIKSDSVPLGNLAAKTTVDALSAFLKDPLKARPSGRMPSMKLTASEARAIAAYLLRDQADRKTAAAVPGLVYSVYEGKSNELQDPVKHKLRTKFEGVATGFAGDVGRASEFSVRLMGNLQIPKDGKYILAFTVRDTLNLLIDGKAVGLKAGGKGNKTYEAAIELKAGSHKIELIAKQGSGELLMSATWLTPGERQHKPIPDSAVSHLGFSMVVKGSGFKPAPEREAEGRDLFANLRCTACHDIGKDVPVTPATDLADLDPGKAGGCLDAKPGRGLPRFALSEAHRTSVAKAIAMLKNAPAPDQKISAHGTMQALNCYACHARQGTGGPEAGRAAYFTSQIEVDLGDEGRIPPHLNEVGAKLTIGAMERILGEGFSVRPYLSARMPQFGAHNVAALPAALAKADAERIKPIADAPPFSQQLVDDGRRLVGTTGLGCVNCHGWGKHKSLGPPAVNLLHAPQRLNRAYVHLYLTDPAKLRPGTRMPGFWPDGVSSLREVADGELHAQVDAIWAYLSLGEKAAAPVGMNESDQNLLVPTGEPIVFRTFIKDVGVHAINVGFRQKSHVCFDAMRVRMAMAWAGDFLNAGPAWNGRGGNFSEPLSKEIVQFAPGSPLAVLESQTAAWPEIDMKAKGAPPGWKFVGYRYDAGRTPTFLYSFNTIDIEETPHANYTPRGGNVIRRFALSARGTVQNLYLRVAVGDKIETEKEGVYVVDGKARYSIKSSTPPMRRALPNVKQELLVPIEWTNGASGKKSAVLEMEVTW